MPPIQPLSNIPTKPDGGLPPASQSPANGAAPAQSRKKAYLIAGLILAVLGGGVSAMKLMSKPAPSAKTSASSTEAGSGPWITYSDPSGYSFSYPKNWRLYSASKSQSVYVAPYAVNSDPYSKIQQYYSQPEIKFYVFPKTTGGADTSQPISSPDTKAGSLRLTNGKTSALIETKSTSYDDDIFLSNCPDSECPYIPLQNGLLNTEIQTLGSLSGVNGHPIDKSSAIYKTELKIWQTLKY